MILNALVALLNGSHEDLSLPCKSRNIAAGAILDLLARSPAIDVTKRRREVALISPLMRNAHAQWMMSMIVDHAVSLNFTVVFNTRSLSNAPKVLHPGVDVSALVAFKSWKTQGGGCQGR